MITSHRNQRRRWAARMLLVWLFGVFAGLAHACVPGSALDHLAPAAVIEHAASHGQQHDGSETDDPNCQEFCALASLAVPSQSTGLDKLELPAIAPGFPPPALAPAPPLRLQCVDRPPGSGAPPIPILIAFLRLAL